MADVSAIPGTARLVEIQAELVADPGGLDAAARAFTDAGTHAQGSGDVVAARTAALDAAWDGRAAEAVVGYGASLRGAYDQVGPATTTIATAVTAAAQALTAGHDAVEGVTDRLAAAVAAIDVTDAPTYAAQRDALVAQATAEAQGHLDTCVAALQQATGQVTGAASATPLSALPPVSAQPFQPGRLAPGDWTVSAPPEVPAGTASQGYGGSAGAGTGGGGGSSSVWSGGSGSSGGGYSGGGYSGTADHTGGGGFSGGGSSGGDTGGGPPGGAGAPAAPEQVNRWIDEAIRILREQGVPVDKMSREDIWTIISHESGGNPNAINDWDSNAAAGTPSKGLMQTIGPTFDSYKLPGHDDIWNPVDNIIAGVRYSIDRYGSVSDVPGVTGVSSGSGYVGY
ncbi:hypothetical protein GCM10027047_33560 [Rhodococcus aerolatus]